MRTPVYLDYHSTTPVDPRVLEAMLPYFGQRFGNASSRSHVFGWEAEKAVELARRRVAALAGAEPREVLFTSGATESCNLAIKGTVEATGARLRRIVTMTSEHRAVLDPIRHMPQNGVEVVELPPNPDGLLELGQLRRSILPGATLVSVMHANNEIGVIQPIREIGAMCREMEAVFHCDAAQSFGKIRVDVNADNIDLMSLSAHKIYGPKGVGALYVRRSRVRPRAQMEGGGHESGFRSGTLNVPGIVGLGEACVICGTHMAEEAASVGALRDRLRARIEAELSGVRLNGTMNPRLPGNLNIAISGIDADALLTSIPDVALSTGSACSSAEPGPSHVLASLGLSREEARSSVRFGLGRFTTEDEVEYAAGRIIETVLKLRSLSPR